MTFQSKWKNSSDTSTYRSWAAMRGRCLFPNNIGYERYGGRGISICDRWLNSYDAFVEDMGFRPEGTTINRINNDGNYEPGNCEWTTRKVQQSNMRTNKLLTFEGKTQTAAEWSRILGWRDTSVIDYRLQKGEPLHKVLTRKPLREAAKHGSRAKYNSGCRCGLCRGAEREHGRQRRALRG